MQKIFKQDLGGNEERAKEIVKYTWEKDEVAYCFCTSFRDVFKVQFTGERWFILSRWGEGRKIYQYKYLEGSGSIEYKGTNNDKISHGEECEFYTTKEEALVRGCRFVERIAFDAIETFEKDMSRLKDYEKIK